MSDRPELRLRSVRLDDESICIAAHDAMAVDRFSFLIGHRNGEPWAEFVERLDQHRRGVDLPPDRVPSTFLLADVDGVVVGRTSIRFQLNDYLAAYGGHIGYGVLAEHRRRGHATEILRQSLAIARAHDIDRVLVTCDDDNGGSAALIERSGGVFESRVDDPVERVVKRRYWIG